MGERLAYSLDTPQDPGWWKCIFCGFMDTTQVGPFWRICPACTSEAKLVTVNILERAIIDAVLGQSVKLKQLESERDEMHRRLKVAISMWNDVKIERDSLRAELLRHKAGL
jgi:hypothetical protein